MPRWLNPSALLGFMKSFLKIPQKVHNALLITAVLAEHYDSGKPVTLSGIAEKEKVSRGFLEETAAYLREANLIVGQRGAGGGYVLAHAPTDIYVGDVVEAVEGPISIVDCLDDRIGCPMAAECLSKGIWAKLQNQMNQTLFGMSLAQMVGVNKTDTKADK